MSTIFEKYQEAFFNSTEQELTANAIACMREFARESGMNDTRRIVQALIMAAKIGIASETGTLKPEEQKLAETVFKEFYKGDLSEFIRMLTEPIDEKEYGMMRLFSEKGRARVGMPLLLYIMSFAYIDGIMSEKSAELLQEAFSVALLDAALNSV